MGVDVVALRQRRDHALPQDLADEVGTAAREPIGEALQQHVLPAHHRVDRARRQHLAERLGDRIFARHREDVGGRALQHRHVGGVLGHRRDQRHRGGAAADHHHPLALVLGLLGPVLGMDDLPLEGLDPGELRRVALVIAVVAAAVHQEGRRERHRSAVVALRRHGPARFLTRPRRTDDTVAEAHLAIDAALARRRPHVVEDRLAVGDRLRRRPRPEAVAERVHVGVGADPGIAEEVPGAADRLARLEDREALARATLLQVMGGADPGDPGADDKHIDALRPARLGARAGALGEGLWRHSSSSVRTVRRAQRPLRRSPAPGTLFRRFAVL